MEEKRITVHIVSHSHWDREWYVPFEIFRNRLNVLMERLFETFEEKGPFKHFTLDGQTIIIEDYLERYPQMTERLKGLVLDGTIEVGPWYILPDEFLIQGETFVRNYLVGQSVLEAYDLKSSRVGYLPDMFGHTAYTPTLLKGLGLNAAVLWRGPGRACRKTEFLWQSENGDGIPVMHLIDSYSNAANFGLDVRGLVDKICGEIEKLKTLRTCDHILLMNGTDHEFPIFELASYFDEIGERTGTLVRHSTIGEYVEAVNGSDKSLETVRGELKDATYEHILKDVLSSRIYLKLMSFEAQQLFLRYVEPLSVLCVMQKGMETEAFVSEIRQGWKLILQSLTHDGIGGCSTDRVQRKVEDRLADALYLGNSLTGKYMRRLFPADGEIGSGDDYSIIVFNPDDKNSEKIVETRIPRVDKALYTLMDGEGKPVAYELREEIAGFNGLYETRWQVDVSTVSEFQNRICPHKVMEQYSQLICFRAHIPPLGFARFEMKKIVPPSSSEVITEELNPFAGFENDLIIFRLNPDGSFNLHDKRNGRVYENLNRITDVADTGDEYSFADVENDQPIIVEREMVKSIRGRRTIGGAEYTVLIEMPLPAGYNEATSRRTEAVVSNTLELTYRLYDDLCRVDIDMRFRNTAKDHKTCFEIAVPEHLEKIVKDSYYGLVRQQACFYAYDEAMTEENLSRYAMEQLSALIDEGKGLMVAARGIHEVESCHEGDQTRARYTLVRSVGMLSKGDLKTRKGEAGPLIPTPEAQCLGDLIHQYAVIPLHEADDARIIKEANAFLFKPVAICEKTTVVPDSLNHFVYQADEELFIKSLKISEDAEGVNVRFLNMGDSPATVQFDRKSFKNCIITDMAERALTEIPEEDIHSISVDGVESFELLLNE